MSEVAGVPAAGAAAEAADCSWMAASAAAGTVQREAEPPSETDEALEGQPAVWMVSDSQASCDMRSGCSSSSSPPDTMKTMYVPVENFGTPDEGFFRGGAPPFIAGR